MKQIFYSLFFTSLLLYGCNDDDESENTGEEYIKIYYTYQGLDSKQLASDNDTIVVNLGDTLFVSIETDELNLGFDSVQILISSNFETEEIGDYEYQCVASESEISCIAAYVENLLPDALSKFYVNITAPSYLLLITEEPSFIIDVAEDSLETIIKADLEELYAPDFYNFYTLTCNTVSSGELQLVTAQNDTISGTFSSTDILALNDITLYYNNLIYNFTISSKDEDSGYYYLQQDLTEEFCTAYPTAVINEVSITTCAIINKE
jgi:hypothetical protein